MELSNFTILFFYVIVAKGSLGFSNYHLYPTIFDCETNRTKQSISAKIQYYTGIFALFLPCYWLVKNMESLSITNIPESITRFYRRYYATIIHDIDMYIFVPIRSPPCFDSPIIFEFSSRRIVILCCPGPKMLFPSRVSCIL